jgi:HAD superfamily hydrolase (TIGR01509 family)
LVLGPSSVLLFDLGGVLVQTRGFASVKAMLGKAAREDELDDQTLRDWWLSSSSVRSFELGLVGPSEFATLFIEEWRVPVSPEEFLRDLATWIESPFPGAEELLAELRTKHHLSCLTNCNELHWTALSPFLRHFDTSFSSHLLGRIKPDAGAYQSVLQALDAGPEVVWFFDDSRANVLGACEIGMKGFLVHGPDEVRRALRREGLL